MGSFSQPTDGAGSRLRDKIDRAFDGYSLMIHLPRRFYVRA
jgi:hypothetical protein